MTAPVKKRRAKKAGPATLPGNFEKEKKVRKVKVKEKPYLGILPMFSYRIKEGLGVNYTAYGASTDWIDIMRARERLFRQLYCLAEFTDGHGETMVVEGGVAWSSMHDFCGGNLATSAFATIHRPLGNHRPMYEWMPNRWRRVGSEMWANPKTGFLKDDSLATNYKKYRPAILDMHAYCGPDPLDGADALRIMRRSVLSGLVSADSRSAIFAADRTQDGQTRPVLETAKDSPLLVYPVVWRPGMPSAHKPGQTMSRVPVEFHAGTTYRNRGSGRDVAMSSVVISYTMRDWLDNKEFQRPKPSEVEKLSNPLWEDICPQILFNNH